MFDFKLNFWNGVKKILENEQTKNDTLRATDIINFVHFHQNCTYLSMRSSYMTLLFFLKKFISEKGPKHSNTKSNFTYKVVFDLPLKVLQFTLNYFEM